jgi:hypothetical protein
MCGSKYLGLVCLHPSTCSQPDLSAAPLYFLDEGISIKNKVLASVTKRYTWCIQNQLIV